jgi:hypothetical protein
MGDGERRQQVLRTPMEVGVVFGIRQVRASRGDSGMGTRCSWRAGSRVRRGRRRQRVGAHAAHAFGGVRRESQWTMGVGFEQRGGVAAAVDREGTEGRRRRGIRRLIVAAHVVR